MIRSEALTSCVETRNRRDFVHDIHEVPVCMDRFGIFLVLLCFFFHLETLWKEPY